MTKRRRVAGRGPVLALVACLTAGAAMAQVNPFARPKGPAYLPGAVYLSDGRILVGGVRLTPGRPLRAWRPEVKERITIPLETVRELNVTVTKTRIEKDWRFKYSGSPEKVYTGETYPRLDFAFSVTFTTGDTLKVELPQGAPIYVLPDEPEADKDAPPKKKRRAPLRFLLQPYTVGEKGQTPKDVVHVTRVVVGEKAKAEALKERTAREAGRTEDKPENKPNDAEPADTADDAQ